MVAAVLPAIAACLTNPVCAAGAAVIAFGGVVRAAKDMSAFKGVESRSTDLPARSGAVPERNQHDALAVLRGVSPSNQDPQDECDKLHDRIENKLLDFAKSPGGDGDFDINGILNVYIEQCQGVDPQSMDKAKILKVKHNVLNFYDELKTSYWNR